MQMQKDQEKVGTSNWYQLLEDDLEEEMDESLVSSKETLMTTNVSRRNLTLPTKGQKEEQHDIIQVKISILDKDTNDISKNESKITNEL